MVKPHPMSYGVFPVEIVFFFFIYWFHRFTGLVRVW